MRWIVLGAGALVFALVVAGCGGGGGSSDEVSTNAISKVAFAKKADVICQKGSERMAAAFVAALKKEKKAVGHQSQADEEALVGKVLVPSVKREIKEFRALGAPSGDEDRISAIVEALEEGVETAENDPEAVTSSSEAVFGIASRLAGEYGLKVCGSR
jgi:hypothetical protein